MLGDRALDRCWYPKEGPGNDWYLVLPDAVRCTVGMAPPTLLYLVLRPGIALVVGPKGQD